MKLTDGYPGKRLGEQVRGFNDTQKAGDVIAEAMQRQVEANEANEARFVDDFADGVRAAKKRIANECNTKTLIDAVLDIGADDNGNCCAGRKALEESE